MTQCSLRRWCNSWEGKDSKMLAHDFESEILVWKTVNTPGHMTRDIIEIVSMSHMSVIRHLKSFGYMNYYDVSVP